MHLSYFNIIIPSTIKLYYYQELIQHRQKHPILELFKSTIFNYFVTLLSVKVVSIDLNVSS
jgi:hypothetical protein